MSPDDYLYLAAILFAIGAVGVMIRRNALVAFMSVELMLNAANLVMVAFAVARGSLDGQVATLLRDGGGRGRGRRRTERSSSPSTAPDARPRSTTRTC